MASNPRNRNGHQRRQLRLRVLASSNVCALCGRPVDKTLHHLDPGAPEVDEIVPVSRGGDPLRRSNVQLVHRLCNQQKGNRMPSDRPPGQVEPQQPTTSVTW